MKKFILFTIILCVLALGGVGAYFFVTQTARTSEKNSLNKIQNDNAVNTNNESPVITKTSRLPQETQKNYWQPPVGVTFQWQLKETVDETVEADVYDIDLFDNEKAVVNRLHAKGRKVFCYISVGSYEDWRSDKNSFPKSVIGKDYQGWPGEKWLDIRKIDLIGPIMMTRFDMCKQKGFDGIEPDNIHAYVEDTGFPLTYGDQLKYNIYLANEAHKRGLSIGLKNDYQQAKDLLSYYDWALTESCFADGWCKEVKNFVQAGKPVFATEYVSDRITLNDFCKEAAKMRFTAILKRVSLDAWRKKCN